MKPKTKLKKYLLLVPLLFFSIFFFHEETKIIYAATIDCQDVSRFDRSSAATCTSNGKLYTFSAEIVGENGFTQYRYKSADGEEIAVSINALGKNRIEKTSENCSLISDGILTCISYGFLKLFAWILGLAGLLFNEVLSYTVLNAGSTLKVSGLDKLWSLVRDVANIILIFSLLFIGISTILRIDSYGAKQLLAKVVMAALLINFSLAFTRIVIDGSNYISYQFYTQLLQDGKPDTYFDSKVGLSGRFMTALSLGTLYNVKTSQSIEPTALQKNSFLAHMLGIVLFIIVAYSFLVAAFHFIARFIVFIVLMILSPLAVLAYFLPFYKSFWNKWWENLWSNAILAPAYFLLIYFSLKAIEGLSLIKGDYSLSQLANGVSPGSGTIALLMNFAIIIGLAVLSLTVARKIGTEGVQAITLTTKAIGKYGGGFLARNTVGRYSYKITQSGAAKSVVGGLIRSRIPLLGSVAKGLKGGLDAGAKASFGASKGGFAGAVKAKTKYEESMYKYVGTASAQRPGETDVDYKKRVAEAKARGTAYAQKSPGLGIGNIEAAAALKKKAGEEAKKEARDERIANEIDESNKLLGNIYTELRIDHPEAVAAIAGLKKIDADIAAEVAKIPESDKATRKEVAAKKSLENAAERSRLRDILRTRGTEEIMPQLESFKSRAATLNATLPQLVVERVRVQGELAKVGPKDPSMVAREKVIGKQIESIETELREIGASQRNLTSQASKLDQVGDLGRKVQTLEREQRTIADRAANAPKEKESGDEKKDSAKKESGGGDH